jgi:thioredoxin 1
MLKYVHYYLCFLGLVFLSACECPFRCNQGDCCKVAAPVKSESVPQQGSLPKAALIAITNKEQFEGEVLKSSQPVVVDFFAQWCGPCKVSKPIFEAIAHELGSSYKFVVVDIDNVKELAKEFSIQGVPSFLFFKEGKVVKQISGAIENKNDFITTIKETFEK